ncbi:MAG: ATP-binding cassette domain-containing protein, partial [Candidatus Ornithospirochaeta sp.]
MANKAKIEIKGVRKEFTNHQGNKTIALNGVDLNIYENEFVCVVGPSGCGKTTLLNILAGLEKATEGSVTMNGEEIVGPGNDRGVIFQQYALFPWLTVSQNISYGLKFRLVEDKESGKL